MSSKIDEIKRMLDGIVITPQPKIGIAITTHNRRDVFLRTFQEINKFAPEGSVIVVIDDASNEPVAEATYRFNENVGIAKAKNKCLELLYNAGCEHFFLFDDDTYPIVEDWHKQYVESEEAHLNYIFEDFKDPTTKRLNDTLLIYKDSSIKAYSHVRGCMCYYKRICLEVCGGMSPIFGKWGFEHPDLSNRIYNAGLTSFRYMDVTSNKGLFFSGDEHESVRSTCVGNERTKQIEVNSVLYRERENLTEYIEFREKRNILLTTYLTSIEDPQRKEHFIESKEVLLPLIESLKGQKLIVLTDCFESGITADGNVEYIKIEASLNPYFQRWILYYQYLIKNRENLDFVFLTDATDVEMLNNPFPSMERRILYTGDEPNRLDTEWLLDHHPHKLIQDYAKENGSLVLLNAGLLGGEVDIVIDFIKQFLSFYFKAVSDSHFHENFPDCGKYDMGLFNYIARTCFNDILVHGTQVNTEFKTDRRNPVSWFKHK